jgi:hypothetical protein
MALPVIQTLMRARHDECFSNVRIFSVFPWKNNLGQPEAEMGTFRSQRSTNFSKRRVEEAQQTRRRRRS